MKEKIKGGLEGSFWGTRQILLGTDGGDLERVWSLEAERKAKAHGKLFANSCGSPSLEEARSEQNIVAQTHRGTPRPGEACAAGGADLGAS